MKKYTVMLIPHDRGSTRTLTLSAFHAWTLVAVLVVLTFASTFLYERQRTFARKTEQLRQANRSLELEASRKPETVQQVGLTEEEVREREERLRAEYEASISAITAELSDLYDREAKARDITGLAPRRNKVEDLDVSGSGGKGGGSGSPVNLAYTGIDPRVRPPHVIYGMARPSADLILQEIHLRTQSLEELVEDMEKELDRIERVPSIWPLAHGAGRITSRFGFRRDPIHHRIQHHNGTDIAAKYGTPVRATAKGVVKSSSYDGFLGHLVKIDHGNGMETWYAHLRRRDVDEGETVQKEDIIGQLGSTGRSTGPHLHYEVHVNGKAVDAEKYLTD